MGNHVEETRKQERTNVFVLFSTSRPKFTRNYSEFMRHYFKYAKFYSRIRAYIPNHASRAGEVPSLFENEEVDAILEKVCFVLPGEGVCVFGL